MTNAVLHLTELTRLSNGERIKYADSKVLHLTELTRLSNAVRSASLRALVLHLTELTRLSNSESTVEADFPFCTLLN